MHLLKPPRHWFLHLFGVSVALSLIGFQTSSYGQTMGALHGRVADPTGAVIPGADISLVQGSNQFHVKSGADGSYQLQGIAPGLYVLIAQAQGFAPFTRTNVQVSAYAPAHLDITLSIEVAKQTIQVLDHSNGVSLEPEDNASARVIEGSDLAALSDDPDQFMNELQTLAGSAAGPAGTSSSTSSICFS